MVSWQPADRGIVQLYVVSWQNAEEKKKEEGRVQLLHNLPSLAAEHIFLAVAHITFQSVVHISLFN